MTEVLRCEGLVAGRDRRTVVRGVDISVGGGEVLALLGVNGAGKTTTLLTIAGILPRLGGNIWLGGRPLHARQPHQISRKGLVLVPDDRALFKGLTVRQTLGLAHRKGGMTMDAVLDRLPGLQPRLDVAAGDLSGGQQQMLAIGRALIQRPQVLLIDELSMGLAPLLVHELLPAIKSIAEQEDMGVVIVEQHVQLVLDIADHAIVLGHGSVILSDTASTLRADLGRIERAYFSATEAAAS